jgi:hypothetical protein
VWGLLYLYIKSNIKLNLSQSSRNPHHRTSKRSQVRDLLKLYGRVTHDAFLKYMSARKLKVQPTSAELKALKQRMPSSKLSKVVLLPFFDAAEYLTSNCKPEVKEELARILGDPARVEPLEQTPLFQTRNINSIVPVEIITPSHRRTDLIGLGRPLLTVDRSDIMESLQASNTSISLNGL